MAITVEHGHFTQKYAGNARDEAGAEPEKLRKKNEKMVT